MRNIKGASLFQYVIVVALVGLLVVPAYFVYGESIKNSLESFYKTLLSINNNIDMNTSGVASKMISNTLKAGDLGGTPSNPIRKCAGDVCSIDYGNIMVNGIPADYNGFVEASGASGATDKIISLMDQLVKQMEANPDDYTNDQVQKIKGLIARGKDIVQLEKYYQDKLKENEFNISSKSNQATAISKELEEGLTEYKSKGGTKEDYLELASTKDLISQHKKLLWDIKTCYYALQDSSNSFTTSDNKKIPLSFTSVMSILNPTKKISYKTNDKGQKVANIPEYNPLETSTIGGFDDIINNKTSIEGGFVGDYLDELKTLNKDSSYDSNVKTLTNVLSKEIFELSQNVRSKSEVLLQGLYFTPESPTIYKTSCTAAFECPPLSSSNISTFLGVTIESKPAERTRLDLGIICSSNRGKFNPDNVNCK